MRRYGTLHRPPYLPYTELPTQANFDVWGDWDGGRHGQRHPPRGARGPGPSAATPAGRVKSSLGVSHTLIPIYSQEEIVMTVAFSLDPVVEVEWVCTTVKWGGVLSNPMGGLAP
jgi:hypothetical protein